MAIVVAVSAHMHSCHRQENGSETRLTLEGTEPFRASVDVADEPAISDGEVDQQIDRGIDRGPGFRQREPPQHLLDGRRLFSREHLDGRDQNFVLVREILIDRALADAGLGRDQVGRDRFWVRSPQQPRGRCDNFCDHFSRALLLWTLTRR